MDDINELFGDMDASDEVVSAARERMKRIMNDPAYRRQCVALAEAQIKEIQELSWSEPEEFTIKLKGLNLLRLHVVLVFFNEILGVPTEDVITHMLSEGLATETYKLGLIRQASYEMLGVSVPAIEDLSVTEKDLVGE
jgi:hypothetical protein